MFGAFDAIDLDYVELLTAVRCFAWHDNPPLPWSGIEPVCGAEVSVVRWFRLTLC